MMLRRAGTLLLFASAAFAQQADLWEGSVDVRNRWASDIGGNSNVYRSVVNLGEGPRLFDGDVRFTQPGNDWADTASLTMSSWGGDPYSTLRFDAERRGIYELRVDYRNIAYFNNLPSFANPLLDAGITTSQRSYDVRRRQLDVDLRLWPNRKLTPFFRLSRGSGSGRGLTTFVSEANEFAVDTDLSESLLTANGGLTASGSRWSLTVEQGASDFTDEQSASWRDVANSGNRRTPFVGRDVVLDDLFQQYSVDGRGLFSRAALQAQPWSRLSFTGQFLYTQPKIDAVQQVEATGDFVYAPLLAPYSLFTEQGSSQASRPRPSGSWTTTLRIHRRLRLIQSWFTDRLQVAGSAAVLQALDGQPVTSPDDGAVRRINVNYNQHQTDVVFEPERRVSLRVGHRYVWGDAEIPAPSFDLRLSPSSEGRTRRHVLRGSAAARLVDGRLRIGGQAERSTASEIYFRTGLRDYWRSKFRASYRVRPQLNLHSSYSAFENRNDDVDIDLETKSRSFTAGVAWTPADERPVTLVADYTHSTVESRILAVQLPFFGSGPLAYEDRGHAVAAYLQGLVADTVRVKAGGALFVGSGSRPTRYYAPQVEMDGRVSEVVRWVAEWRWYGFGEELYRVENFRAHTLSLGFRLQL